MSTADHRKASERDEKMLESHHEEANVGECPSKQVINRYRAIMESITNGEGWMDWRSDIYVHGMLQCVEIATRCLPRRSRFLDLGCGMGLLSVLLANETEEVTGVDIDVGHQADEVNEVYMAGWGSCENEKMNPDLLKDSWRAISREFGIDFLAYDGRSLPFEDGSFDAVVAHAVLEHIHPDLLSATLLELKRVLRKGGELFVFRTPRTAAYLEHLAERLGLPVHDLTYTEEAMTAIVESSGFSLCDQQVTDMLPSFPPFGLTAYNWLSPVLVAIDEGLLRTPLRRYAHHMALTFRNAG